LIYVAFFKPGPLGTFLGSTLAENQPQTTKNQNVKNSKTHTFSRARLSGRDELQPHPSIADASLAEAMRGAEGDPPFPSKPPDTPDVL
jgi:hypothetical protein